MYERAKRNSIHDILRLVFRRLHLFLLGASLFAIGILVAAHFVPLNYKGEAIFEFGLEVAAEQISKTSRESFGAVKERLRYDLAGYLAVEKAVTDLQLTQGLPHDNKGQLTTEGKMALQQLVRSLMKRIDVKWEARSDQEDLIALTFSHPDPWLAQQLPNTLVGNYIDQTYKRLRDGLKRQHEFLARKVRDINEVFEDLTKRKVQFEVKYAGILPDDPGALQNQIQDTRARIEELRRRQAIAKGTLTRLKSLSMPNSTDTVDPVRVIKQPNPELTQTEKELHGLKDTLDSALTISQMTEKHPKVQGLRLKIARLEERLKDLPAEVIKEKVYGTASGIEHADMTMAMAAAQSEMESTASEVSRLSSLMKGYEDLWANFAPVREGYLRFLKEWDDRKFEADSWKKRLENVEVALGAAMNNRLTHLNAVQPAQRQFLPASPSVLVVLGVAGLGALTFGGGLVFLGNRMDRSITTSEEAQSYFQLPVHGVIGEIVTPSQKTMRRLRRWTFGPVATMFILVAILISGMSIVLRLRYCKQYEAWKSSPVSFVSHLVQSAERFTNL